MTELKKRSSKVEKINTLIHLFSTTFLSEKVYIIKKDLKGDTPDVSLWMSSYDYRSLVILANGSSVSVFDVEVNTLRWREDEELPEGTEKFKYVVVG